MEDRIDEDDLKTKPTEIEDSRDDDGYPYDEILDDGMESRDSVETFPPKTITLQKGRSKIRDAPTIGLVQLCYDKRREMLIPMMEVSDDGGRSKTGRRIEVSMVTPESFPPLARATSSPTHSAGTISTLSVPDGFVTIDDDDSSYQPALLGEELHTYLLHESSDPHHFRTVGCGDAIQKMMKSKMIQMKRKGQEKRPTKSRRVAYRPMNA